MAVLCVRINSISEVVKKKEGCANTTLSGSMVLLQIISTFYHDV